MFSTEINHLFQQLNNPVVYWFLNIISILGTTYFLIFILFTFIAGVDFRKGFLIANIFGWTILLTILLKNYIDFPRPLAVDSSLQSFGSEKVETDLSYLQPQGFFELFSAELLAKTRESNIGRTGLPSGHTSSQIAVWISLALLFRKRWLWIFSITFVILTMVSRIFLAQHFLGDVVGGMVLGILILSLLFYSIQRLSLQEQNKLNKRQVIFFLLPLILVPLYKHLPSFQAGSIIGLNIAFVFIVRRVGNPKVVTSFYKRIINILNYFVLFVLFYLICKQLHLVENSLLSFLVYAIISFVSIVISTFISKWFNLVNFVKA